MLENKLFVKTEKYEFNVPSVTFLGYIIEEGQVRTNPDKVRAVAEWPKLTSHKHLQQFQGFTNFSRFISDYSRVASPLSQLTSPGLPFCWTPEVGAAFAELKKCFSSASRCNLIHPGIIVEVNASNSGVGVILSQ